LKVGQRKTPSAATGKTKRKALVGFLLGAVVVLTLLKVGFDLYNASQKRALEDGARKAANLQAQKNQQGAVATPEHFQNLLKELQREKRRIGAKEAEIAKKEAFVKNLDATLQARANELIALEQRLVALSLEAQRTKDERIEKLSGVYENMDPEQAARAIEEMDPNLAVAILLRVRKREAGRILGAMDPQKASKISQDLIRLQGASASSNQAP
jgi:flagellar motility protein MotE (MotC chaperone)